MSFLNTIFGGGVTNQYTPSGLSGALAQTGTANTNYGQANTGLNTLAGQLQAQASGQGPNLANAQLAQATGQNVANQASLMAGQRGASQNVGLLARQAAQQGAATQQQAAGQAAQNRLAQQIAAQQNLGGVLGTQGSLANQNYGVAQNAVNEGNQIQGQIAQNNTQANQSGLASIAGTAGKLVGGMIGLADGGSILGNLGSGFVNNNPIVIDRALAPPNTGQSQSNPLAQFANNFIQGIKPKSVTTQNLVPSGYAGSDTTSNPKMAMAAKGGKVGNLPFMPRDFRKGGPVKASNPQQKATVPGNSYSNDKIPGMLSENEIVLPREVTMAPDAPIRAAKFVAAELAKKKGKR